MKYTQNIHTPSSDTLGNSPRIYGAYNNRYTWPVLICTLSLSYQHYNMTLELIDGRNTTFQIEAIRHKPEISWKKTSLPQTAVNQQRGMMHKLQRLQSNFSISLKYQSGYFLHVSCPVNPLEVFNIYLQDSKTWPNLACAALVNLYTGKMSSKNLPHMFFPNSILK